MKKKVAGESLEGKGEDERKSLQGGELKEGSIVGNREENKWRREEGGGR